MFKMCLNTKYKPAAVVCSVCDWKWDRWNALAEVKCLYSTWSAHYFCFSDDVHCMKSIIVCHSDEDCFVRLPAFLAAGSRPVIAVNSFPRDVIIYSPPPPRLPYLFLLQRLHFYWFIAERSDADQVWRRRRAAIVKRWFWTSAICSASRLITVVCGPRRRHVVCFALVGRLYAPKSIIESQ